MCAWCTSNRVCVCHDTRGLFCDTDVSWPIFDGCLPRQSFESIYIYTYIYIYIYVYVYICIHMYTYIYMYIYVYMRIYMHTFICMCHRYVYKGRYVYLNMATSWRMTPASGRACVCVYFFFVCVCACACTRVAVSRAAHIHVLPLTQLRCKSHVTRVLESRHTHVRGVGEAG